MADDIQREILPIPDRPYSGFVAYDADHFLTAEERLKIAMARQ